MTEQTRTIPTQIGMGGRHMAKVTMTPSSDKVRCEVNAPPTHAIPIVFVPGIMGSPLMATSDNASIMGKGNRWAWFPDKTSWVVGFGKGHYGNLSPAQRKQLLDPSATRAFSTPRDADRGTVKKYATAISVDEALARGWGSVMLDSYGELLNLLEAELRSILTPDSKPYPGIQQAIPRDTTHWGELKGYVPLTPGNLVSAADFHYPVYAVGYNWLRSNSEAADYLRDHIKAILGRTECELGFRCEHGVILVTHSMGGLVGRMCAKRNPNLIQGVIHGVQPATGAATAYRRVRAGWEDMEGAVALGNTGKKIMPIFANAAGPLELLPNQRYGESWLRVTYDGKSVFDLPKPDKAGQADPYTQIYLEPRAWWRLMDPAWINPVGQDMSLEDSQSTIIQAWNNYGEQIKKARKFHADLGSYYHPNTYTYYGADNGKPAFHRVTWVLTGGLMASSAAGQPGTRLPAPNNEHAYRLRLLTDNYEGRVTMVNDISQQQWVTQYGVGVLHDSKGESYMADMRGQDEPGDATVPAHSAEDTARNAVFSARMTGFKHQNSYQSNAVKNLTLYAVLRIGGNAKELPKS